MTSPVDPTQYSPVLSAMFKMLDRALDQQLHEHRGQVIEDDVARRIRQRVANTLLWGTPAGYQRPDSLRGPRYDQALLDEIQLFPGPEGQRHVGGLLGGDVTRAVLDGLEREERERQPETPQASVLAGPAGVLRAKDPTKEPVVVLGPDEETVRQYASAHGYTNVYVLTSRNPSAVRGLLPGSKVIQIGRTSPDIERILSENGNQVEHVSE